ncbi:acyltransferase [Paenibacillus sp. TAB 01]|uniref:acyltransferase n=1 Tax=Paenibacillus sp. TAB 01 TaxID=3368988 RepID=UPI0037536EDC
MAKKTKIEEIQYLRGFAFLAVVLQHAIGHYAYEPEAGLADGTLLGAWLIAAKFAVPMFIFITGLVLFYNYPNGVSYGTFLLKRCKDIMLPYLLWSLLYAVVFGGIRSVQWPQLREVLHDWLTGKASYHLWYVVMVIQLYIAFPLIQSIVQRVYRALNGAPWLLRTLFLLLCAGYVLLTGIVGRVSEVAAALHVPVLTPLFTEYADRNALYFIVYFLLGAAAGLQVQEWKERLWRWRYACLGTYAVLASILLYRIVDSFGSPAVIQFNATLLLQPFMALFLLASVLAMCIVSIGCQLHAGQRLRGLMAFVGRHSYGAYLAHALMLTFSTAAADVLLPGMNVSLRTLAAFALCAGLSLLTSAVLGRFHFGSLLTGAPAPRKPVSPAQGG